MFSGRFTCTPHSDYPRVFEWGPSCGQLFFHWGGRGCRVRILVRGLQLSRGSVCCGWDGEKSSTCITSIFVVGIWGCRIGARRRIVDCWLQWWSIGKSHYGIVEDFQLIFHLNLHVQKFLPKLREFNCTSAGTGVGGDSSLGGLDYCGIRLCWNITLALVTEECWFSSSVRRGKSAVNVFPCSTLNTLHHGITIFYGGSTAAIYNVCSGLGLPCWHFYRKQHRYEWGTKS